MKVLLVSKELAPYTPSGGIGTYTSILANALGKLGVDAHVLCVDPGLRRRQESRDGFTVHTGPMVQPRGIGRLSRLPAAWGRLTHGASVWREYRKLGGDFDVVEVPELYAEGLFITLREPVPAVVRLHSSAAQLFPYLGRSGLDLRATVALENAAIRRADVIVSTAPNLAEAIEELCLEPARTRAIIYPVRRRELAPEPGQRTRVLFVGRLERLKNPDVLIAAARRVLSAMPDARFRFVGSDTAAPDGGSYQSHLVALARELGVGDAIEFAGHVPHQEVFADLKSAAVCAFPSRSERFGNVVAEAASIGRPVVVSDIPAFRDFVEDGVTGRVVAVENPDAWSEALLAALRDPDHARMMALRLRDELAHRADPRRVAQAAIESYEAAIARRTQRR